MSKMILRGHRGAEFKLNVTQFRATMTSQIDTVQTRTMAHHFPVRAGQPDIQFTAQFRSIDDKHAFQNFVRDHQRNSQVADQTPNHFDNSGMVTLFWPERGITNWTGYITSLPVREARFDYAPRVTFGVMLVGSMLSERTYTTSLGNAFDLSVIANQLGPYVPRPEDFLRPPTVPTAQQQPTDSTTTDTTQQQQVTGPTANLYNWAGGVLS